MASLFFLLKAAPICFFKEEIIMRHPISTRHYRRLPVLAALVAFLLSGCTGYQPKPLAQNVDLATAVDQIRAPEPADEIKPTEGLSLTDVAIMAVRNNPDLKAQRKRLGVTQAHLFSAGLLPDPQLSASLDHPTGSIPGTVNAFGLGLGYDIMPLINRSARLDSAKQAGVQADLELLWQEWQVAQQARSLALRLFSQQQQITLLKEMKDLYLQRYQRSHKALEQGNLTLAVAGTDLTALLDSLSQINQLEQAVNETRHALNLVLGLAPGASLKVRMEPPPPLPDAQSLHREIETMPQRRPDLLALQAGYRSQESKVRAAILSQFPSLNIGIDRARDTGDVSTNGISIGLNLPLFSARGAIAIERATREQLHQEYQARLDRAAVDVDKLIRLQGIIVTQQRTLDTYLPTLKQMVVKGREAYQRGDIDAITFINMETTWIKKRLERISLEQMQRENLLALQTLLALPGNGIPKLIEGTEGVEK